VVSFRVKNCALNLGWGGGHLEEALFMSIAAFLTLFFEQLLPDYLQFLPPPSDA
jgi:hypothetical protein